MVLEVNSSPGLQGIEKATGLDVAGEMIGFVLDHAHSGDTRDRARG
jgi:ribosomal protein S6--L-glutamate ligase